MVQHWPDLSVTARMSRGVAVLVDGENIPQTAADEVIRRAEALGPLITLRVYCDRSHANGWDGDPRFRPVYLDRVSGKNSADIHLVIDAMEISHDGLADSIVLVSCDRDFAPLATRLRDKGLRVLGLGRSETGPQLRHACSEFFALDSGKVAKQAPQPTPMPVIVQTAAPLVPLGTAAQKPLKLPEAIAKVIAMHRLPDGTVPLHDFGRYMWTEHKITLKDTKTASWKAYLKAQPAVYVLEGPKAKTTVRLTKP